MTGPRVATIPDDHPYIAAVLPPDIQRVRFPGTGEPWDPSPLLTSARTLLASVDVVHVHFGYESLSTQAMQSWIAAVHAAGVALVLTVHDLRNPHQLDNTNHDAHLRALIAAADEIITLTDGAAAEIQQRWQRTARVLAHPTLLADPPPSDPSLSDPSLSDPSLSDPFLLGAPLLDSASIDSAGSSPPTSRPVVGIHLKSLRANVVEPHRIVRAVAAGADAAGAALRIDIHPGSLAPDGLPKAIEVSVHPRFTDSELLVYLQNLTVSVLPYQFGSHSGWLELCRDLGIATVVPDCGYYLEQWPQSYSYGNNDARGLDEAGLSAAVAAAVRAGRPARPCPSERYRQRVEIRAEHSAIYRRVACAGAAVLR